MSERRCLSEDHCVSEPFWRGTGRWGPWRLVSVAWCPKLYVIITRLKWPFSGTCAGEEASQQGAASALAST